MQPGEPGRLLRIHISERDRYQGKPLYEAIVAKCREMNIAGATVFRGVEGYGDKILICIVDSTDNLHHLSPVLEEMLDTGLIAVSDVTVVRVQKKVSASDG